MGFAKKLKKKLKKTVKKVTKTASKVTSTTTNIAKQTAKGNVSGAVKSSADAVFSTAKSVAKTGIQAAKDVGKAAQDATKKVVANTITPVVTNDLFKKTMQTGIDITMFQVKFIGRNFLRPVAKKAGISNYEHIKEQMENFSAKAAPAAAAAAAVALTAGAATPVVIAAGGAGAATGFIGGNPKDTFKRISYGLTVGSGVTTGASLFARPEILASEISRTGIEKAASDTMFRRAGEQLVESGVETAVREGTKTTLLSSLSKDSIIKKLIEKGKAQGEDDLEKSVMREINDILFSKNQPSQVIPNETISGNVTLPPPLLWIYSGINNRAAKNNVILQPPLSWIYSGINNRAAKNTVIQNNTEQLAAQKPIIELPIVTPEKKSVAPTPTYGITTIKNKPVLVKKAGFGIKQNLWKM